MAWGRKKSGGTQGAAIRARRLAGGFAPWAAGPDSRRRRQAEKIIRQTQASDDDDDETRRASASRARAAAAAKRRSKARGAFGISRLFYWGAVLGLWARDRRGRRRGLGRRASAADPVAGNSEAAADHPDRRPRRQRAGDARRNGRRQCRAEGPAALSAEGLHRDRGPAVLFALRRRSARASCARRWPTSCIAASRKAARR